MDLRTYLFEKMISQKDFAKQIKYTDHHLRNVIYKRSNPSERMIDAIIQATNGEVTEQDFKR